MTLLQLPDACLHHILQQLVPNSHSICSAAQAHSRLHTAAVAVQRSIKASHMRQHKQHKLESLLLYLRMNGQHVTSLQLEDVELLRELPACPQVHQLNLSLSSVQLGGSSRWSVGGGSKPGVLQAVQQLTRLEVHECALYDSSTSVAAALAQLPGLQHLSLECEGLLSESSGFLAGLTNLTHLGLYQQREPGGPGGPGDLLQDISCMRHLQQLRLSMDIVVTREALSGLQQLTLLHLSSGIQDYRGPYSLGINTDVLSCTTQLQHLQLVDVVALGPPGDELAIMLSHIGKLQQLTHLSLVHSTDTSEMLAQQDMPDDIPAAACAALTASSKLAHLTLSNWPVPDRGWEYVFRAGQQLLVLQQLSLECQDCAKVCCGDLGRLVSCCPNLQQLSLTHALGPSDVALLRPLLSLSQLTKLALEHPGDELTVLPQLTGLCDLNISTITESGLLQLSGLQQLTALSGVVTWPELNPNRIFMGERSRFPSFKSGNGKPSVQQQILQYCKDSHYEDVRAAAARLLKAVEGQ